MQGLRFAEEIVPGHWMLSGFAFPWEEVRSPATESVSWEGHVLTITLSDVGAVKLDGFHLPTWHFIFPDPEECAAKGEELVRRIENGSIDGLLVSGMVSFFNDPEPRVAVRTFEIVTTDAEEVFVDKTFKVLRVDEVDGRIVYRTDMNLFSSDAYRSDEIEEMGPLTEDQLERILSICAQNCAEVTGSGTIERKGGVVTVRFEGDVRIQEEET